MSDKTLSYYEEHPEELTDEIAATLMLGGTVQGDTEAPPAEEEEAEEVSETLAAEPEVKGEEEPVVLAKDGKHTIPFEELEKARADAKQWEQASKEKDALIEQMKAAQKEDAATGTTQATDDLLATLREDYPTLADAMQQLVENRVKEAVESMAKEIEPLRQRVETSAIEGHFSAIRGAHSDFDTIVESGKLQEWVKTLPSYARPGAEAVLSQGTAQEVIDLLNDYKGTLTKPAEIPSSKEDIAKKAQEVVEKAKGKTVVPGSLSDVPAGGLPASDELGNFESLSDTALMGAFLKMDPNKLQEKLARLL